MATLFRFACIAALGLAAASLAQADEGGQFYGLLRVRDLSPFGSLRLIRQPN